MFLIYNQKEESCDLNLQIKLYKAKINFILQAVEDCVVDINITHINSAPLLSPFR